MRQGCRIDRAPCPLASGIKALVWHDNRMAKDVSRDSLISCAPSCLLGWKEVTSRLCNFVVFSQPRGSAITRSDAFAVVVAKLGFNSLSSAGRNTRTCSAGHVTRTTAQDVPSAACAKDGIARCGRFGRAPCPLASRIKALVWHDERVTEDVSRDPLYLYKLL